MTFSPTANMLATAIDASGLSLPELAARIGFRNPSVLTMIKQGITRVPLDRIPNLSRTLGIDEREFLAVAIQEYHPGVYEILVETLGLQVTDAELGILTMFRMANIRGQIEIEGPFRKALEGMLELAAIGKT